MGECSTQIILTKVSMIMLFIFFCLCSIFKSYYLNSYLFHLHNAAGECQILHPRGGSAAQI